MTFISHDDPNISKNAAVEIKVDNLTVEQCSDVIVSLTNLVPDFKTLMRYEDLHSKPDEFDIQKRIRLQAPLYYLRNQIVKSGFTIPGVKAYRQHLIDLKRKEHLGVLDGDDDTLSPD